MNDKKSERATSTANDASLKKSENSPPKSERPSPPKAQVTGKPADKPTKK